jgi:hypothetical protein
LNVIKIKNPNRVTTIVFGQGEHVVEDDEDGYNYLHIKCPVNIVGSRDVLDKSNVVVVGGFKMHENIHGNVHVEHLTIRGSKYHGVAGSSSFTLNDLMIDQCEECGVWAYGSTLSRCTNIKISNCQYSGVCAVKGATIIDHHL